MNAIDARDALLAVCEDIKKEAENGGFTLEYKCRFGDIDFGESDEYNKDSQILFAELSLGVEGVTDRMIYELALGFSDGAVADEELSREVASLRDRVREALDAAHGDKAAFSAYISENTPEDDIPEEKAAPNNTKFYLVAAVGAFVIVLLFLLLGKLFG